MGNSIEQLMSFLRQVRECRKKVALCHGCFDGLHEGHLLLLKKARETADVVVIGIEGDEYVKKAKGNDRPFYSLDERIEDILETSLADFVFVIPFDDGSKIYKEIYKKIRPDFLVTGDDEIISWKQRDAVEENIEVIISPRSYHSSTALNGEKYYSKR